MRKDILFMGAGEHSLSECWKLLNKFMEATIILSGIQQPIHAESKEQEDGWIAEGEEEIKEIVIDIAMALTGKKIEFKELRSLGTKGKVDE